MALVIGGCGFTCRGCVEHATPGHVDYRYHFFNGPFNRTVNASAGETLTVDYAAIVEEGTLDMRVVNPDGDAVWQETFDTGADVTSSTKVDIQQNGRYRLVVDGHDTRGSFQIDWQVN
jgi:methionine-rich copper-binding protein CopC